MLHQMRSIDRTYAINLSIPDLRRVRRGHRQGQVARARVARQRSPGRAGSHPSLCRRRLSGSDCSIVCRSPLFLMLRCDSLIRHVTALLIIEQAVAYTHDSTNPAACRRRGIFLCPAPSRRQLQQHVTVGCQPVFAPDCLLYSAHEKVGTVQPLSIACESMEQRADAAKLQ